MKPRTVTYIIVLLILLVFVLANWAVITRPTQINLLVARVDAPLGILLLLIAGVILAIDAIVHALSRHAWTKERRSLTEQLERQRARADEAEASRIQALHELVERETAMIRVQLDRIMNAISSRQALPDQRTVTGGPDTSSSLIEHERR